MGIARRLALLGKVQILPVALSLQVIDLAFIGVGVVGEALSLHEVMLIDVDNGSSTDVVCSYGVVTAAKYGVASAAAEVLSVVAGSDKGFISNFAFEVSKHRCYERELVGLTAKVAF